MSSSERRNAGIRLRQGHGPTGRREGQARGRSFRLLGTGFRIRSGVPAGGRRRSKRSGPRQPRALALGNGVKGDLPLQGQQNLGASFLWARQPWNEDPELAPLRRGRRRRAGRARF